MLYRVIGLMSGSSLDGLDIAYVSFQEQAGTWSFEIEEAECLPYSKEWEIKLKESINLSAREYQLLHTAYGHYTGSLVNHFIDKYNLQYKAALIASHGHTTFHIPEHRMTAQLGDGAAIAAATQLPVVSDLRAMDIAFGGQGAPIVPVGEKLLFNEYDYFLNLGGIANISFNTTPYIAFDVCPANRVLNMLMNEIDKEYDEKGRLASTGTVNQQLLDHLNGLGYYNLNYPKSLANDFGTDTVFPLIKKAGISLADGLRTFVAHIVEQLKKAIIQNRETGIEKNRMLVTGGGALNDFLIQQLSNQLSELNVEVVIPVENLINYKEAVIMGFMGVLRWRQENNVLSSVTGAERDSIGGALWIGQEA